MTERGMPPTGRLDRAPAGRKEVRLGGELVVFDLGTSCANRRRELDQVGDNHPAIDSINDRYAEQDLEMLFGPKQK